MRAIVTGATNGIGLAIARRLAADGNSVVLVGRSDARLAVARERIATDVPGAGLGTERADFADLAQVRDLAKRIADGALPDVVVSNAALVAPLDRRTADGRSRTLTVNHLAPYLLLRKLAEPARAARFVIVGADPRSLAQAPVDLDDLDFTDPERLGEPVELRPFRAYGRTKNMNTMFVYALARRLAGTGITVNGAHPGIIGGTGLAGEAPPGRSRRSPSGSASTRRSGPGRRWGPTPRRGWPPRRRWRGSPGGSSWTAARCRRRSTRRTSGVAIVSGTRAPGSPGSPSRGRWAGRIRKADGRYAGSQPITTPATFRRPRRSTR